MNLAVQTPKTVPPQVKPPHLDELFLNENGSVMRYVVWLTSGETSWPAMDVGRNALGEFRCSFRPDLKHDEVALTGTFEEATKCLHPLAARRFKYIFDLKEATPENIERVAIGRCNVIRA